MAESVETAQEVSGYEPDKDQKVTVTVIKKALKAFIDDLMDSAGTSARMELNKLKNQDKTVKAIEKRIRETKTTLKEKSTELD